MFEYLLKVITGSYYISLFNFQGPVSLVFPIPISFFASQRFAVFVSSRAEQLLLYSITPLLSTLFLNFFWFFFIFIFCPIYCGLLILQTQDISASHCFSTPSVKKIFSLFKKILNFFKKYFFFSKNICWYSLFLNQKLFLHFSFLYSICRFYPFVFVLNTVHNNMCF